MEFANLAPSPNVRRRIAEANVMTTGQLPEGRR